MSTIARLLSGIDWLSRILGGVTMIMTAILIVVTVSDSSLGLPAALVYALAFTVEFGLSMSAYFGGGDEA